MTSTIDEVVIKILDENILSRCACPKKIIIDIAKAFTYVAVISFFQKYNIILGHSTTYYPHGNGLVESSNKNVMYIIKRARDSHLKCLLCGKIG
jgi:hypothetical protein